jgi:D-alanyl-D-alanine carboxypeptidase
LQNNKLKTIDSILKDIVEKGEAPSVQYRIFNTTDTLHEAYLGYSNLSNGTVVNRDTAYHVFSVTKTFTALAVLQLADKKNISIDAKAIDYIPRFSYGDDITLRHLLSHSAGIPNPIPLNWIHLAEEHNNFNSAAYFEPVFKKNNKPKFSPNSKFGYSNLGYILLADFIENISGVSFENYIADNILAPLNIANNLNFSLSHNHMAKGYHNKQTLSYYLLGLFFDKPRIMGYSAGKWRSFNDYYINGNPYGGLIGTADSLAVYLKEILSANSALIPDKYKHMLFHENIINSGKPSGMCMSWYKGSLNNNTYYTHAGGGGGFYCEVRVYPEIGTGSVLMFNKTGMTDLRYLDKLDSLFIN